MTLESSSDFSSRSVIDKVIEEMQAKRNRATAFLNGRNPYDLSDKEFAKLQKISGNNYFDKRNPEHVKTMENRKIFDEREEYLKKVNDRTKIGADDYEFGLNIRDINRYVVSLAELALNWADDRLCCCLVNNTVFVHDRRKLQIPWEHGEIIAEPDEIEMSEESMNYRGVTRWGQYAYDLDLDVTLDLREYNDSFMREVFSFYFALKLSQVAFHSIDDFLNYQLIETFKGDFGLCSRFLTLLMRQKITMPYKDSKKAEYSDKELLEVERVESVKEWLEFQKQKPILTNNSLITPIVEQDETTILKENDLSPIVVKKIYGKLSPQKIEQFLGLLGDLRNKKGNTLLESKDVKALQKINPFANSKILQ
jgi:hypothetical protein